MEVQPIPKSGSKRKKKQLGFDTPPLGYCQYCGITASYPYVIIERHHIDNKKAGGRNDDPYFHSPENRIDLCEGPCSSGCHKKADQRKPGYLKADLLKKKEEDLVRVKEYNEIIDRR